MDPVQQLEPIKHGKGRRFGDDAVGRSSPCPQPVHTSKHDRGFRSTLPQVSWIASHIVEGMSLNLLQWGDCKRPDFQQYTCKLATTPSGSTPVPGSTLPTGSLSPSGNTSLDLFSSEMSSRIVFHNSCGFDVTWCIRLLGKRQNEKQVLKCLTT